jgi:geranylgeranyl diphosphate synthase type II
MTFPEYVQDRRKRVDEALDHWVPADTVPPHSIHKAMRYSLFAGGKRIRPVLCMAAAESVMDFPQGAEQVACTLEMIHTYSLIHDDLPAMDNDDLRRGLPTCHKVFGDALAILAGDALCTLAFEVLGQAPCNPARQVDLIVELARASGSVGGMIAGQVQDIEGEGQKPDAELLQTIHHAKTGALLKAALRMGGIFAGADQQQLAALSCYGEHIGLAFQIVDDVLDVEQPSGKLGKTAGKDAQQHKITFPAVYGMERSHQMAEDQLHHAHLALSPFEGRAERLRQLADFIVSRET